MNCANHADTSALAFCRTCGKPLCAKCTRDVRGVIYCEDCLAAQVQGTMPPRPAAAPPGAGPTPAGVPYVPVATGGPNPALAGILAGIFPSGVGAVYTSQYAKGLAHLLIFTFLVWGQTVTNSDGIHVILGLSLAFFYVYQIVDAVRSARALQVGQAPPDPFGLAHNFGAGEKLDTSKVPVGAIVLIGLGILFLLHSLGIWEYGFERFWPLILIVIGGWLFARRWGMLGGYVGCHCERCRSRGLIGPALMITIGMLFMLEEFSSIGFHRTWPVILLVIGAMKLWQSNASTEGHMMGLPGAGPTPPAPPPPVVVPPVESAPTAEGGEHV